MRPTRTIFCVLLLSGALFADRRIPGIDPIEQARPQEPQKTEPQKTDPAKTDPKKTDPASTDKKTDAKTDGKTEQKTDKSEKTAAVLIGKQRGIAAGRDCLT